MNSESLCPVPRCSNFPCPEYGALCKGHYFKGIAWRHLNFSQHHCYITADVPRIKCNDHGVKKIISPWARKGSKFTLLFEQAALMLVREMPVLAAGRIIIQILDKELWGIVSHYVSESLAKFDMIELKATGLDETLAKKRHNYMPIDIDLDQQKNTVVFAVPGKGQDPIRQFNRFLTESGDTADNILEVTCDISRPFLSCIRKHFSNAEITVDWFNVVQIFTRTVKKSMSSRQRRNGCQRQHAGRS